MPSYFCSTCRTNWPIGDAYKSCPDCDQFTFHDTSAEPDVVESVVEHAAVGTQTTDAYAWRVERYVELGFAQADAHVLASSQEQEADSQGRTWTRSLTWHTVEAALAAGCSHQLALAIFAT
jgi:hypothetical protein